MIDHVDERLFKIRINTPNGKSVIACKSTDKEDNMRGRKLRSLSVDEASFMRPSTWNNILRPMLADYEAPAIIGSSPRALDT